MTFIPQQQHKQCFIACSKDKVDAGLCDCINRMRNEALRQPPVIGSVCHHNGPYTITKDEDGNETCCKCKKPLAKGLITPK
jgi:hypothetical protein